MSRLTQALNRDDRQALVLNIALASGVAAITNGAVLALLWDTIAARSPRPWFEPPAWVAGAVWLILLALVASARWKLNSYTIIGVVPARRAITTLIACCILWPVYALAAGNPIVAFVGNTITLAVAVTSTVMAWPRSQEAALRIVPTFVWLLLATVIVVTELGWL